MKRLYIPTAVLFSALLFACEPASKQLEDGPFNAMVGSWLRTNDAAGSQTYEQWDQISATNYKGMGYTISGVDTSFAEEIALNRVGGEWLFVVTGVNEKPTPFKVIEMTEKGFSCENQLNEFPTHISYDWSTDTLKAAVKGGSVVIDFDFIRE